MPGAARELWRAKAHPTELVALLKAKKLKDKIIADVRKSTTRASLRRCYEFLNMTSDSFALVIQLISAVEVRDAMCMYYLMLRALDTVEDDMSIPAEQKTTLLKAFHTFVADPRWSFQDSQDKDKDVLIEFPTISKEVRWLSPDNQAIITDIIQRMGDGMTYFLENDVVTLDDWDKYCHIVAGLTGIGLSRQVALAELESPDVGTNEDLANAMGLFLQKTNIIRDFSEDLAEGRVWWPKDVWSKYADSPAGLAKDEEKAVECLHELIANALQHLPSCKKYMERLQTASICRICCVPQILALETLYLIYNNAKFVTQVIKPRLGYKVKILLEIDNFPDTNKHMSALLKKFSSKVPASDSATTDALAKATLAWKMNKKGLISCVRKNEGD